MNFVIVHMIDILGDTQLNFSNNGLYLCQLTDTCKPIIYGQLTADKIFAGAQLYIVNLTK